MSARPEGFWQTVSHTLDAVVNDELTTSSPLPTNIDGKAGLLTQKPHLPREFRIYHGPSLLREGDISFPQCLHCEDILDPRWDNALVIPGRIKSRVVPDVSQIFSRPHGFYNEKLLPCAPGFLYVASQTKPPTSVHPFMRTLPPILLSELGFANVGILRHPAGVVDVSQVTVSSLSPSDAADSTAAVLSTQVPMSVHAPQATRGLLGYRIVTDIQTDNLPSTLLPPDAGFRGGFGFGGFRGGFGGFPDGGGTFVTEAEATQAPSPTPAPVTPAPTPAPATLAPTTPARTPAPTAPAPKSSNGASSVKASQVTSTSSKAQNSSSGSSLHRPSPAGLSSQVTHTPSIANPENTLGTSSSKSSTELTHTSVIVGVLVPLLSITLVIAILIHRRCRQRRRSTWVFYGLGEDRTPNPPPQVSSTSETSTLSDVVCEKDSQSQNTANSRSNNMILASSSNGPPLSRTSTFASSNWPDTPLPPYARPLPDLPPLPHVPSL
ncbi:hypothetical protein B0H13DRAFT_1863457 [Mycena leptocephala]|nr:hypothetical protein B0H13DRAFT_1863457 [Mycena leptocephala]